MKLDDCVSFQLARAARALYRPYTDALRRYRLTAPRLFVLLALYERDNVTAGALATRIDLDKSTLTGILTHLERDGLIARAGDENDGRTVRVTLTDKGRKMRRRLTAICDEINRRHLEALSAGQTHLIDLLAALEQASTGA